MSTAKTTTIQIEIPAPPDTHFLLPQEWKGKVKFQEGDRVYSAEHGRCELYPDGIWQSSLAVARLRPRNPQGLSDDVFRVLPMDARALSDAELKRLGEMGGLVTVDEKLIYWNGNAVGWVAGNRGIYTTLNAYATLHPADHYLNLPDSAFVKGKKELAVPTPPVGCELVEDPDYIIKEVDMVWSTKLKQWEKANACIGMSVGYVARPIATPVWNPENLPQVALGKVPEGERLLSKSEHDRLVKQRGVSDTNKHILRFYTDKGWFARDDGSHSDWTYCTPHPEGYFDTLPAAAFNGFMYNATTLNAKTKPQPKFKDWDKVLYPFDSYKGVWKITSVDAVQGCIRYSIANAESRKIHYVHEDYLQAAKPVWGDESFDNTYNKPKAEEEPEEQHPEEDTTQDRPHTFGSCPRHGFVRMKGCREVRPFCITEKGITPFQRAFRDWKTAMNVLEYSLDGHKWGKFAQKGAK